jgi:selenocysteine lyase/cysteine desulfurase
MAEEPWNDVIAAEAALLGRLERGLRAIPRVTVHGPQSGEGRAPTTIFNIDGRDPGWVAHELAERHIAVWSGDNYACELIDALGLRARGGAVRAGIVRYTTSDDVDALLDAVTDLT